VLPQQRIEKFLPVSEVRGSEAREGVNQVNYASARSQVENSERACDFETLSSRYCGAFAVVHEDKVGRESQPERDCGLLAFVQRAQRRIIARTDIRYFKPVGPRTNPVSH
jgi:hypothetical protein